MEPRHRHTGIRSSSVVLSIRIVKGEKTMKTRIARITAHLPSINEHHVRLFLLVITLALFVLGAGAPGAGTGPGGQ